MTSIRLPRADGTLERYEMGEAASLPTRLAPSSSRVALAAAHVVLDARSDRSPVTDPAIDWDATMRYRHHLWDLGLGVAEAMDTAQRETGLRPEVATELMARSMREAEACGGRIVCGAATDDLDAEDASIEDVVERYLAQCAVIEAGGGSVVLMASRALARCARGPEDYLEVYERVLGATTRPVILHWLGAAFDPALAGYWGSDDLDTATETVLALIAANRVRIDGIKLSLLDADREVGLRRRLPAGVRLYTGDDLNYPALIRGDEHGASDALLGVFDPIAPVAAQALHRLDAGDAAGFDELLTPTLPLARTVFAEPTRHYKTGVVFLAYLRGFQDHFRMVGGAEGARSVVHLGELFRLADQAGLLAEPDEAVRRMAPVLAVNGIDGKA